MEQVYHKLKTKSLAHFSPIGATSAAVNAIDKNKQSRLPSSLAAAQAADLRIAADQRKKAQAAIDEEDEINFLSPQFDKWTSSSSSSRNGGGGGSSREGGGGKGKERERGSSKHLDSDDDDDDDLPEVGAIGGSYGRARTNATSSKKSSKSAGKSLRRRSSSPPPSKRKLNVAASPSPSPLPSPPRKQAPLPNFKKKANTTSSTTKLTKNGDISNFLQQPKASTSTTSSSSKRPIHDLDSPERDLKPLDLDTSPSPSRSPSPPRSRKLNGSTSRRDVAPRSSSSDMEIVEDALSPQKPPTARPKPKAKTLQGVVGVGGVSNPFGVKTQPVASSSTTKHLQPSNSDAPPFAGSKPSTLASSSSKPSKMKKTSSAQLPDSSEEESEEERDTVRTVGGVALVSMARKKVKLTPGAEAKRKAAEVVRAAMEPGEEFDDLVETEEDEEEEIVVDLRKKKVVESAASSKEGKSELKATAKRSRILELATLELEAGLKDKAAKERKVELYGEEDEVYETDHPHPHPELLCIFCSELLPPVPSPKLLALILRLKKLSRSAPTIFNPRAVSLSMIKSINACTLHRSESKQFPIAKKNGWPMEIDWAEVQRRVKDPKMVKHLGQIIESKDSNPFLLFAKERAEDVGVALARTAKGQYEVFEKAQPGYFGEIGQILFHQMLSSIFIPSRKNTSLSTYGSSLPLLTSAASSPLTPSDFVYFVLIPELALRLIQQDLGLKEYIEAYDVMLNSRAYGNSRFAAEEGEAAGGVLMQGWDEDGEEMHDGADDGILVSRRRRVGSADGESSKGKAKGKEAKRDAAKPLAKGLRPPSSPPSDDGGPPRKKPTAVLSSSTTTTSSTKTKPNPFTLTKRPRSASPNPPPPSKRRSPSPPPKSIKRKSSPSTSTPKPPPMHPFFQTAKKESTVVAPPPPPSTSSSTSKDKSARPKPKPALAPSSSSSTSTSANAIAGSSKPKPKPRIKSPVKIDLDSDSDKDAGEQRRKEERDKTVTPPKQPKKRKENEYMELEEEGEGESQETTVPESPKGKKGRRREEQEQEEGRKSLERTHSMKRTESENQMWASMPSDGVDFDEIFG